MALKITKIGGSNFIIIPSEYVKVYKLLQYQYTVNVSKDGKVITYTQAGIDKDLA